MARVLYLFLRWFIAEVIAKIWHHVFLDTVYSWSVVIVCVLWLCTLKYDIEYLCVFSGKSCVRLPRCNSLLQRACSTAGRWSLCCQRSDSRSASDVLAAASVNVLSFTWGCRIRHTFLATFLLPFFKIMCWCVFWIWIPAQVVAFELSLVCLGNIYTVSQKTSTSFQ